MPIWDRNLRFFDDLRAVLALGVTRQHIAETFGVDRRTIYRWEHDRCWPRGRYFLEMHAWLQEMRRLIESDGVSGKG